MSPPEAMPVGNWATDYLDRLGGVLRTVPGSAIEQIAAALAEIRAAGGTVFVCGNGGSAATAAHWACDLAKVASGSDPGAPPFRALALCDQTAMLTAYANDDSYESAFAGPLRALARAGDALIAVSTSGNSPNVLEAVRVARELGLRTIALTGGSGGKLADAAEICLRVGDGHVGRTEDAHLVVAHLVCYAFAEAAQRPGGGQATTREG